MRCCACACLYVLERQKTHTCYRRSTPNTRRKWLRPTRQQLGLHTAQGRQKGPANKAVYTQQTIQQHTVDRKHLRATCTGHESTTAASKRLHPTAPLLSDANEGMLQQHKQLPSSGRHTHGCLRLHDKALCKLQIDLQHPLELSKHCKHILNAKHAQSLRMGTRQAHRSCSRLPIGMCACWLRDRAGPRPSCRARHRRMRRPRRC